MNKETIRHLSELSVNVRAFLSVYLTGPDSVVNLDQKFDKYARLLNGEELAYFKDSAEQISEYLKKNKPVTGICLFCCRELDYFEAYNLNTPVEDLVYFDSSPYILPLLEANDEYENFALVLADNKDARIYFFAETRGLQTERIRGNIKNHVKVGGWSQQRYERRRDKSLLLYAKSIVQSLSELVRQRGIERVVLAGGKETLQAIRENLPQDLIAKLAGQALDPGKDWEKEILQVMEQAERSSEKDFFEKVREQYLRSGPAVFGFADVLEMARQGRVERAIALKGANASGIRCRECELLSAGSHTNCPGCGKDSVFSIDMINEIGELLIQTGAELDMAEDLPKLSEAGGIAALLRY